MSDTILTRRGTALRTTPAPDYEALLDQPTELVPGDGAVIVAGGHGPVCADCGLGTLRWAEAGHVPWHRICDRCGSHWDLHQQTYIQWGPGQPYKGTGGDGYQVDAALLDPDDRLPDGVTHMRLLALAVEHGTQPNGPRENQRVAGACWARRAQTRVG